MFNEAIFKVNEELKERLVLNYGASLAKTVLHKGNSASFLPDSFLETEIIWPDFFVYRKHEDNNTIQVSHLLTACKMVVEEEGGQMTSPFFEIKKNKLFLVWATFFNVA